MASYTREYEYNGSSGTKLRVTLTTTATSIANNTTTERVKVDFIHTGSSFNKTPYTASINFNGTARTKTFSYSGAGTINLWNFTQVVPHNTDGTKTANLTITDNRHNSPYTTTISVNDNFVLDAIPRNAVFTSVPDNIEIEKPFTIEIDRRGASSVELGIYDTSGAGTFIPYFEIEETSFTFELDEDEKNRFYNNMPTSTSKKYRFYLKSDIGETISSEKTFKIKAEIPSTPVFTHEDTNATTLALTGSNQKYIQNYSDLKINITEATAFQGATITNYAIINGRNSKESAYAGLQYIDRVTSSQLQVIIQDSRGLTSQSIITLDYIPYTQPTIQNFLLNREIGTSTKADLITNGLYTNVNFGLVANKINKVEYRKKSSGDYGAWITLTGQVTYGGGLFVNAPTGNIDDFTFGVEFTVEIKVSDELSFNTRTAVLSKGLFLMLIDQEYQSIGIGEIPKPKENSLALSGGVYSSINLPPRTETTNLNFEKTTEEQGTVKHDIVTNQVTQGRPEGDGFVTTYFWDNSGNYDSQLFIPNSETSPRVPQWRSRGNGTWGEWNDLLPITTTNTSNGIRHSTKFPDGTLINSWRSDIIQVAVNTARGSLYESANITPATYLVNFIEPPAVTFSITQNTTANNLFFLATPGHPRYRGKSTDTKNSINHKFK